MNANFSATRNTCFALISAIEADFRVIIENSMNAINGNASDFFPQDVFDNTRRRYISDHKIQHVDELISAQDLLDYIDFPDIKKIIDFKLVKAISPSEWISNFAQKLLILTPTRNRVCHTRPLEPDDLTKLLEFARELSEAKFSYEFFLTRAALKRLELEPTYVLTLQIPRYWAATDAISHNLPIPEFDETGFLGRTADRIQVLKHIRSSHPVVTIVGEGGVGKTALALRCLYDLLEDASTRYDAIVWVSLKVSTLTQSGVRNLVGAITSTLGVFSEIAQILGTPSASSLSEAELIDEVIQYLELYKVLIAIDNLETVSTGPLRELLLRIPSSSKVLITSRVGLNEFEVRYPLQGLDEKTSVSLFRSLSRVLNVDVLLRLSDVDIKKYTLKLFNSPLLIKWFVAAVGGGADPDSLTSATSKKFSDAIAFCFMNLFDRLNSTEKIIVHSLASARKPLSTAEIHYVNERLMAIDIEQAMSVLHNSSLIVRSKDTAGGVEYQLTESSLSFLECHAPPPKDVFLKVQSRLRELRVSLAENTRVHAKYEYDPLAVRVGKTKDEQIAATYLRKSISYIKNNIESARDAVNEACRLTPGNSEVWRIAALVEGKGGDLFKALKYYEQAVDIDPNSKISRYSFGIFLVSEIDDAEKGLEQLEVAEKLDPDSAVVKTGKAMALSRLGRYREASLIHDQVLIDIGNRERRWRISGIDQAADCYRRWANQCWELKEYDVAKSNFMRSISILECAVISGDIDASMLRKLAKIFNDALGKRELSVDSDYIDKCICIGENIVSKRGGVSIPISTEAVWALKSGSLNDEQKLRFLKLDSLHSIVVAAQSSAYKLSGVVSHFISGNNFAFIEYQDKRLYFNKKSMVNPGLWLLIKIGVALTFNLGSNQQGECAVDVDFSH